MVPLCFSGTATASNHQGLIYEVLFTNSRIVSEGEKITFMWVPAHSGVPENEKADKLTKEAIRNEIV